jgi:hypothetical protein
MEKRLMPMIADAEKKAKKNRLARRLNDELRFQPIDWV